MAKETAYGGRGIGTARPYRKGSMQIDGLTVASSVARDPALMRGVEVVLTTSNSSTFKHSDVRSSRMIHQLSDYCYLRSVRAEFEGFHALALKWMGRSVRVFFDPTLRRALWKYIGGK